MFAFVGLEIRSIYLDQTERDAQQTTARHEQLQSFGEIAKGIETAITNSQEQFSATMQSSNTIARTTQRVAELAQKSLENITGGESFAYIVPQTAGLPASASQIPLAVHNGGDSILTGVTVTVLEPLQDFRTNFFDIGTLHPREVRLIPTQLRPTLDASGIADYWLMLYGQNGMASEGLKLRRKDGLWDHSYHIERVQVLYDKDNHPVSVSVPILIKEWGLDPQTVPQYADRLNSTLKRQNLRAKPQ